MNLHAMKITHTNGSHKLKPSIADFKEVNTVYSALYSARTSPDDPIPVRYFPSLNLDDKVEILAAVRLLRAGKAPGPSGLKVDDLKRWAAQPDAADWRHLADLAQQFFTTGRLLRKLCYSILVVIPKFDGGSRGYWFTGSCVETNLDDLATYGVMHQI